MKITSVWTISPKSWRNESKSLQTIVKKTFCGYALVGRPLFESNYVWDILGWQIFFAFIACVQDYNLIEVGEIFFEKIAILLLDRYIEYHCCVEIPHTQFCIGRWPP